MKITAMPWCVQLQFFWSVRVAASAAMALAAFLLCCPQGADAYVPPSRSLAPPMGWNSWYHFIESYTAREIVETADALVSSGLRDVGYTQVGLDAGWWTTYGSTGRDASGNIIVNSNFFSGTSFSKMSDLTAYLHQRGLTFGVYTDTGTVGCGDQYGSGGYETQDAALFASWGVDHIKVDHCGGNVNGRTTAQSYAAWRDAITRAPQNPSPWNYLRGVLAKGARPLADVEDFAARFVEDLGGEGEVVRSSHALDLLADVFAETGRKEEADLALRRLGEKWDPIRVGYWNYRRQIVAGAEEGVAT